MQTNYFGSRPELQIQSTEFAVDGALKCVCHKFISILYSWGTKPGVRHLGNISSLYYSAINFYNLALWIRCSDHCNNFLTIVYVGIIFAMQGFWEWQPCLFLYGALLTLKTIDSLAYFIITIIFWNFYSRC